MTGESEAALGGRSDDVEMQRAGVKENMKCRESNRRHSNGLSACTGLVQSQVTCSKSPFYPSCIPCDTHNILLQMQPSKLGQDVGQLVAIPFLRRNTNHKVLFQSLNFNPGIL